MIEPEPLPLSAKTPSNGVRIRWRSLSDGFIVSFLITGPTLLASLVLRDQREPAWKGLIVVAAVGLLIGGGVAGRYRRRRSGALLQGAALGFLTSTIVLVANLVRVLMLGKGLSTHSVALWLGIELESVALGAVGALLGRWWYLRSRRSKPVAK